MSVTIFSDIDKRRKPISNASKEIGSVENKKILKSQKKRALPQ